MISPTELREIVDQHVDRLLLIARSIGEPAEDAVQEAFVAFACEPRRPDDPLAWLVRVTRNRLLQWHRGDVRRRRREQCHNARAWFDGEAYLVDRRIDARIVTEALQSLERELRETIVMHLWGGLTFDQIAAVTGVSRATAHRQYQRGLDLLRQRFCRPQGTDADLSPAIPVRDTESTARQFQAASSKRLSHHDK